MSEYVYHMRIGIYAEPLNKQKAGVFQFTQGMIRALETWGRCDYVLFSSQAIQSAFEVRQISEASSVRSLRRWIRPVPLPTQGVDLVLDPTHFGAFGLTSKPMIRVVHDLTAFSQVKMHRTSTVLGHRLLFNVAVRASRHVLTVSKTTQHALTDRIPTAQASVNYPGTFITEEPSVPKEINHPYFLSVGTTEPRKNIARLLNAFGQLETDHRLVIVGAPGWKFNLKRAIEMHPCRERIDHLGYVDRPQLASLYRHATALVYPSLEEGFGLPVLEAMALGCPVITSNRGSMHEISSGACMEVQPESVEEIADAMHRLASDSARAHQMVEAQLKRSRDFHWKTWVELFEEIAEKITRSEEA